MGNLYLEASLYNGKTIISDSSFTSPFKITKPFYTDDFAEVMVMQASAGILEGDRHNQEIRVKNGAKLKLTGQSYTKIFSMENGYASQNTEITVESNAEFYYLPCPVIPFGGSEYINTNKINLEKGSKFILWDIFSCGRVGMDEQFLFRKYHSRTIVYEDEKAIFCDNARYIPNDIDLYGIGYFEKHTHTGMMYFYGYDDVEYLESERITGAVTKLKNGFLLRVLGSSSEDITDYMKKYL